MADSGANPRNAAVAHRLSAADKSAPNATNGTSARLANPTYAANPRLSGWVLETVKAAARWQLAANRSIYNEAGDGTHDARSVPPGSFP
jgi:hypothetical protein